MNLLSSGLICIIEIDLFNMHISKRYKIMVFILDGSSEHGAHVWSKSGIFYLLKAFGYIKRVVKSDFLIGKDLFYFLRAQPVLSCHLI